MLNIDNKLLKIVNAFELDEESDLYSDEHISLFEYFRKDNMTEDEAINYILKTIGLSFKTGVLRGKELL